MINKRNIIYGLMIVLVVVLVVVVVIFISTEVRADIFFSENDNGTIITIEHRLPIEIITTIENTPQVLWVEVEEDITNIQLDGILENQEVIREWLNGLEYILDRNKLSISTFPGYPLPNCKWDYGTEQKIGVYWYNGNPIVVQNDTKC